MNLKDTKLQKVQKLTLKPFWSFWTGNMLDILFGRGIFLVSWNGIYREDADSAEGAECGPGLNYTTCCEHLYTSPSFYSEYKCQPKGILR